jgi:glycerol uptake operon antiterminator
MLTQSGKSLPGLLVRYKTVPVVSDGLQLRAALASSAARAVMLRHCNPFELLVPLKEACGLGVAIYVYVDHLVGIAPDLVGLRYLREQFHAAGLISHHPRILAQAKSLGLETIQRLFAVDSTGLEAALESVDPAVVDLLDIAPALAIPHVVPYLPAPLPLPFIGSGLLLNARQKEAVLRAGAVGVVVARRELW